MRNGAALGFLVTLVWAAVATADPEITPTIIDFGEVPVGQVEQESISLTNDLDDPIRWKPSQPKGDPVFSFGGAKKRIVEPGETESRSIGAVPAAVGRYSWTTAFEIQETILDKTGNPAFVKLKEVPVTLVVTGVGPGLEVTTSTPSEAPDLDFGDVVVGSTTEAQVTITNRTDADVVIESVRLKLSDVFAYGDPGRPDDDITLGPGESLSIPIEFSPDDLGAHSSRLTIRSPGFPNRFSKGPKYKVRISGNGVDKVGVSTEKLKFGEVENESEAQASIGVTNRSDKSVPITVKTSKLDPAYTLSVLGDTVLAPLEMRKIGVTIAPTEEGRAKGKVIIKSEEGFVSGKETVKLKAKVVEKPPPPPGDPITLVVDGTPVPMGQASGTWLEFDGGNEIRFLANALRATGFLTINIDVGFSEEPELDVPYPIPGAVPSRRIAYDEPSEATFELGNGNGTITFEAIEDDGDMRRAVGSFEGLAVNRFGASREIEGTFDLTTPYQEQ